MPILGLVAKPLVSWFKNKQEMQAAKQAGRIKWAGEMAKASNKSWKDEYLTIVWTLPIVLGMFGYTEPLERLLVILNQIPDWYTYLLLVITLASFGLSVTGRWQDIKTVRRIVENPAPTSPGDKTPLASNGPDFSEEE